MWGRAHRVGRTSNGLHGLCVHLMSVTEGVRRGKTHPEIPPHDVALLLGVCTLHGSAQATRVCVGNVVLFQGTLSTAQRGEGHLQVGNAPMRTCTMGEESNWSSRIDLSHSSSSMQEVHYRWGHVPIVEVVAEKEGWGVERRRWREPRC